MVDATSSTAATPKASSPAPAAAAPAPVYVRNVSRRMLTLNLTGRHLAEATVDEPHRYKPVKLVTVSHAKNGVLAIQSRNVRMASSLRVPADTTVEIGPSALHCPEVKAALAAGALRVVKEAPKPEPDSDAVRAAKAATPESK